MKWYQVQFHGRNVRVPALKAQGRLWFHWQGETHVVSLADSSERSSAGARQMQPGVIVAPMPGKITRVAVQNGEKVAKGQALLVMEAMKMEYTLESDQAGSITDLKMTVGQQVSLGDVLVRVVNA